MIRSNRPSTNPLASFMISPSQVHFETQDTGEHVLLLLRQAFITNIRWIATAIVMALLPPTALMFVDISAWPENYTFMGILVWYVFVFGFVFENFLTWYFNVYIVTDERVIDYDFYSLLFKRVSASKIDDIQDVTYEMAGIASSILNYGNVYIQTAAERIELEFHSVPNPELVVRLLNELILEEEREELEGRVH